MDIEASDMVELAEKFLEEQQEQFDQLARDKLEESLVEVERLITEAASNGKFVIIYRRAIRESLEMENILYELMTEELKEHGFKCKVKNGELTIEWK